MPTEKLYWHDPFAVAFEAKEARVASFEGKPSIVLERTLFYPEAGGQLGDSGLLDVGGQSVRVVDVQIDDLEDIHHIVPDLEGALAAGGGAASKISPEVTGTIDRDRRRDHMAQHTAQHMLSRALADVAHAETVSARLGATACTIDVNVADVAELDLVHAEDLVNAVITDDVVVCALFPTQEELATMQLRREPKVVANIRVIDIDGFDKTPCGGTHCTRTGQIGTVRIAGTERYKGKLRVFFNAGKRAVADARAKEGVLGALAKEMTCGPLDVGAAVAKLQRELKMRLDALSSTRGELVELLAARILEQNPTDPTGTTRIVLLRDRDDVSMLRALAGRLASRADVVAFCASPDPETKDMLLVVERGARATFDAGRWFKGATAKHGGRGGGRAERAEGRLPSQVDLASLARQES
jgi:alanyl-tRNA synthetase